MKNAEFLQNSQKNSNTNVVLYKCGVIFFENLAKFLENLKDAEFYNVEENKYFKIVREEFTGFMSLFNRNTDPDVVKYCKVVSDVYALLK